MAKLIFILDGNVIKEYMLDKERMTIGRRAANDIHIDNLAISGEHAVLITDGEETYVEDLNSTNGTLVNDTAVKKHVLKHGDTIGLGKYELKYLNDPMLNQNQPQQNAFADTVMVVPEEESPESEASDEVTSDNEIEQEAVENEGEEAVQEPDSTPAEVEVHAAESIETSTEDQAEAVAELTDAPVSTYDLGPRLEMLSGEEAGNSKLLDKSMIKLGEPGKQVAVITKREQGFFITHVAGESFPIVNGQEIGAQAHALAHADEIEVMDVKMKFFLD